MNVAAQFKAGYAAGQRDWNSGAVDVLALQDDSSYGRGYRAARKDEKALEVPLG